MEEKLKIHVSQSVYKLLVKDCESFEFYKGDGRTVNKNAFLTALICNYYRSYQNKEEAMRTSIRNILKEENIRCSDPEYLVNRLFSRIQREVSSEEKERVSSVLSLKPTKESAPVISYISNCLLSGSSLSEFFRNMFSSYAMLPQDQREKIIFRAQYDAIQSAIRQNRKIFFSTKEGNSIEHESSPYAITESKEELHCYLLTKYNGQCRTYRLSRITAVTILPKMRELTDSDIQLFEKMVEYGPQFDYRASDATTIVFLTKYGKNLYQKLYLHRPKADFIEGSYYYFNCSRDQLSVYFRRFGKEAYVISPASLRAELLRFYKGALARYSGADGLNKKIALPEEE